jgi:hypothetical protein
LYVVVSKKESEDGHTVREVLSRVTPGECREIMFEIMNTPVPQGDGTYLYKKEVFAKLMLALSKSPELSKNDRAFALRMARNYLTRYEVEPDVE